MKIAYIVPRPVSKGPLGAGELRRREQLLNGWALRATNIPVLELMKDPEATKARLIEVASACVREDRADAFLFGCMTMSFLDMAEEISAAVGVPVVNAAKAALKEAETLVSIGLSHSKTAFPMPAKMRAGTSCQAMRAA
ncbi:aspartate/glutamate racemase family protein [Rhizobium binxianense]